MNDTTTFSPTLQLTVTKMTGDMRFVGIINIIFGALECLSIIGAVVGIPLIICGLRLRESADAFKGYLTTADSVMLENALERQSRYFFIQKVLMIIGIILIILSIILWITVGIYMFSNMSRYRTV